MNNYNLKCLHCGAPIDKNARKCSYCDSFIINNEVNDAANNNTSTADDDICEYYVKLLIEGEVLKLADLYRKATGASLQEAKKYIDTLAAERGIQLKIVIVLPLLFWLCPPLLLCWIFLLIFSKKIRLEERYLGIRNYQYRELERRVKALSNL